MNSSRRGRRLFRVAKRARGQGWRGCCGLSGCAICISFLHREGAIRPDLRQGKGKGAGSPVSLIEAVNELAIDWFTCWDGSAINRTCVGDQCILASNISCYPSLISATPGS